MKRTWTGDIMGIDEDLWQAMKYQVVAAVVGKWQRIYKWRRGNPAFGPFTNRTFPKDAYPMLWDAMNEIVPEGGRPINSHDIIDERSCPKDYEDHMFMISQLYAERAMYGKWGE